MNREFHIEPEKIQQAADRTVRLSSEDWKHLEICRVCLDSLAGAIRQTNGSMSKKSAA